MATADVTRDVAPCPWHREAFAALQERVSRGLPHALLLCGEAGIGKRRFAEAFAAWLLCGSPRDGVACGHCRACELLAAGTHPDACVVVPEALRPVAEIPDDDEGGGGRSSKRKPSREIVVDDIRALIRFAGRTAQRGRHRIAIVDPADAMNVNAANALLKTLEEPGEDLVLFLVTDKPARLPATVRSRCQRLSLPSPSRAEARAWLASELDDASRADGLLAAAGMPLRALAMADSDWPARRVQLARMLVDVLTGRTSAVRFGELAGKMTSVPDAGAEATEPLLLDWLPTFISDAIRLASGVPEQVLRNPDLVPELRRLVEARTTQPLFLLGDDVAQLRQQLQAGAGLNRPLLWEEVMLRWSPRPRGGR